ncbi:hypothetical protein KTC96_23725 (plasmid) [Clostridium estertheticum]|uniref:hypothetical protein n=2 Tax=Clostridium estertheticum TaxID=238834 RepID=UPI001C7D474C|nr:hypothetical protein [Clostridium estertheticum]MBX4262228.1 hypothetical protein [Clostridium estertheticum]WLC72899.1 hypothetical protein KTC96_23725 [Clostridium estertheticum]
MSNISSTTVIIIGLIAIILLAFRQRKVVSSHRGLLNIILFVITAIMIIFAGFYLLFQP